MATPPTSSQGSKGGPAAGSPYDGVRPRNACCPACGYVQGGQEIRGGSITCPECGTAIRFELVKPVQSPRSRVARGSVWVATALVAASLVGVAFIQQGRIAGLLALAAMLLGLATLRLARVLRDRALGHDDDAKAG